jgi:hypothetical protein
VSARGLVEIGSLLFLGTLGPHRSIGCNSSAMHCSDERRWRGPKARSPWATAGSAACADKGLTPSATRRTQHRADVEILDHIDPWENDGRMGISAGVNGLQRSPRPR